jgi:hypothetical protein
MPPRSGAAPSEAWRWWSGVGLRVSCEGGLTRLRMEWDGGMLVHDLPSAPNLPVASGDSHPGLHGGMVFVHARETPKPVGQSHVTADGEVKVLHLGLEGVRGVGQGRLPRPSPGSCPCGLEQRFHVEDDDIRRLTVP